MELDENSLEKFHTLLEEKIIDFKKTSEISVNDKTEQFDNKSQSIEKEKLKLKGIEEIDAKYHHLVVEYKLKLKLTEHVKVHQNHLFCFKTLKEERHLQGKKMNI